LAARRKTINSSEGRYIIGPRTGKELSALNGGLKVARRPVHFPQRTRRRRKLDERLWVRLPALIHISTAAILRLPQRSRLRRALVDYWVRRSYEIVNRRDFELALAAQHPEVVIRYAPDPRDRVPPDLVGEFHGYEGFRRAWAAWLEAFQDLRLEPEEVTDLGGERLLIAVRAVGSGTESGIEAEQRGFTLYTFRAGRVVRHEFFFDRDQAEEAAGLIC
jgi:ketosteroid isomerase-like protein